LDDKHSKVICAVGSLSHHIGLKIALDGSLSGKCIATKNVEVCAETQKNEHNNKELSLKMGLASLAVAPLIHADESIGVLKLMSSQINAFANHDLQTLKILAHVVGNALQQRINTDLKNNLISEMKDVTDALFKEKELAQVTLSAIGDAVITTDTEGQITYLNPVAEHLTGWLNEEAIGKNIQAICNLVHETTKTMVLNPVFCCLITKTVVEMEPYTLLINRQGIEYAIDDSAAPILDREGKAIGAVLIFRDVTQEREMTREISYQASHDSLTGLFNRSEFNKCVANSLEKHQITKRNSSLLYMDLDQFKIVNDTCGHGAGDQLLLEITQVFEKVLRSGDIIARLGGDEFGVLLEGCPPDISYNIADTLLKKVENYRFHWDTQVFTIGVSIGLVNFSVDNFDLTLALSAADAACYVAKERGRNQICVYEPTAAEQELRSSQMGWIGRIQKALEDNRLVLFAQPIVPVMKSDKCSLHYEMLLRMLGEDGKLIPPMAFIPSAERYNLMTMIDRWVVKTALQFAKKHSQAMCSINLSGQSLGDEKFLNFVKAELVSSDVNCANICFEVTETTAIASFGRAVYFMQELKVMGCRFSLDDFGSGMSSFNYLKQLPVDYLKIDGGFVKNMANDPIDHAMVESINNIGHIMGLHTIAEFVEDENILNMLNALGVDYAQGYGIGKPVNANSIDVIQAPGIIIPLITED
jgi:diguanylate cyclase (GGDEF)-like protein/PAS domain S-box-containing protein